MIGLDPEDVPILDTALALCDLLRSRGRGSHVCEQLALSEALRLRGVAIGEAAGAVTHYWRSSAKRYVNHRLRQLAARPGVELWRLERPIPYSYARVQWHKWAGRLRLGRRGEARGGVPGVAGEDGRGV